MGSVSVQVSRTWCDLLFPYRSQKLLLRFYHSLSRSDVDVQQRFSLFLLFVLLLEGNQLCGSLVHFHCSFTAHFNWLQFFFCVCLCGKKIDIASVLALWLICTLNRHEATLAFIWSRVWVHGSNAHPPVGSVYLPSGEISSGSSQQLDMKPKKNHNSSFAVIKLNHWVPWSWEWQWWFS